MRDVREARAQLLLNETKRSLELLDNFMARVVHHLKEPLHVLLMGSGFVADKLREAQTLNNRLHGTSLIGSYLDKGHHSFDGAKSGNNLSGNTHENDSRAAAAAACEEQSCILAESAEVVSQAEESVTRTLVLLDDISDLMRTDAYGAEAALPQQIVEQVNLAAVGRAAIDAMEPCHPGVTCELIIDKHAIEKYIGGRKTASPNGTCNSFYGNSSNCSDGNISEQSREGAALTTNTDPILLKRALVHLLNNAAAATTCGSVTLRLTIDDTNGQPLLSVEDTGPGLSSASIDNVQMGRVSNSHCGCIDRSDSGDGFIASSSISSSPVTSRSSIGEIDPVFERYHHEFVPKANSVDLDEASMQALRNRLLSGMSSRTSQRLGLGLSLSYKLVQSLGGELQYATNFASRSFDNNDMDGACASGLKRSGTRFWFSLPTSSTVKRDVAQSELTPETATEMKIQTITAALAPLAAECVPTTTSLLQHGGNSTLDRKRKEPFADDFTGGINTKCMRPKQQQQQQKHSKPAISINEASLYPDVDAMASTSNVLVIEDSSVCAKLICMQVPHAL